MTTPDFSKIFGTNATSTQNWSDSNYLTGWGFLGQAPPPYQLFDDYFKNTDTNLGKHAISLLPMVLISWDDDFIDVDFSFLYWSIEFSFEIQKYNYGRCK